MRITDGLKCNVARMGFISSIKYANTFLKYGDHLIIRCSPSPSNSMRNVMRYFTKMIRSFEKTHPAIECSDRVGCNGRVPIFDVSASLVEKDRQLYIDGGFGSWIPKPIDFKRLSTFLVGIVKRVSKGYVRSMASS